MLSTFPRKDENDEWLLCGEFGTLKTKNFGTQSDIDILFFIGSW